MIRTVLLAIILVAILVSAPASHSAQAAVKVWEENITIPTYRVGPNNPNPIFYSGRKYQGAKGPVYPYPLMDNLTDEKIDRDYKAVYLENEYVRIGVLPELGGRIFEGLDKTNGYNFFYRQHVIKPALIGMIGAWISGGVEWNVPHHHRASTFMPVDYTIVENKDGSKTIWVGEIEWRHRMKWIVGLTLRPGKSYLEANVKFFNRTPVANSILYWANVAVHTNNDYQVIFPPHTRFATHHSKVQFSRWPIADGIYGGADFRQGVDVSWWKNHPKANSMFAWNFVDDFLAGYDHGKEAGTLHVADHNLVVGKKFFTWGNDPAARMWDQLLSDTDGPYLELMVGAWSDNQPDYSWVQPYEVKETKQYWYPFRDIGGVKNANLEAAVNLEVENGVAKLGFNATASHSLATMRLAAGEKTLFVEQSAIGPGEPFHKEIEIPTGTDPEQLTATLTAGGRELIRYSPIVLDRKSLPAPVKPPAAPEDIKSSEELFLTGLRLEQFYNPQLEPYPYYEEALRRDPGDSRANTQLALNYLKRGLYAKAERHLRAAVERVSRNYTRPKDGEPIYYLGVALRGQNKLTEAADAFHRATWSYAWSAAAYYQLAEIASIEGDYAQALRHLDWSILTNAHNTRALNLRVAMLRKLGRRDEARRQVDRIGEIDPLGAFAANESLLLLENDNRPYSARFMEGAIALLLHGDPQNYLELATDYAQAGLWKEAGDVADRGIALYDGPTAAHPMLQYFRGWFLNRRGKAEAARDAWRIAAAAPPDYCFPFRLEAVPVLRQAAASNPDDGRVLYYLGNLLYDIQPEGALEAFSRSIEIDRGFSIAYRNLGLATAKVKGDLPAAIASLTHSLELAPDARVLFELDQLAERAGEPAERRLARFEADQETTIQRDDALSREIALLVEVGRYDDALRLLAGRHLRKWEGIASVHGSFVAAHIYRGHERFAAKDYKGALADYLAALEFPANLEAAKQYRDGSYAAPYYFLGRTYQAMGDQVKARDYFGRSIAESDDAFQSRGPDLSTAATVYYYKALSLRDLGREQEAGKLLDEIAAIGQRALASGGAVNVYAKFGQRGGRDTRLAQGHYVVALALLGRGETAQARRELEAALKLNPNHTAARLALK